MSRVKSGTIVPAGHTAADWDILLMDNSPPDAHFRGQPMKNPRSVTPTHVLARQRVPKGFTLVELLVVTVIVLVLATVSFSVSQTIRGKAQASLSTHNIRQLFTGHQVYLAEYSHFPSGNDWGNNIRVEADAQCKTWHERLGPYVGLGSELEETQKQFRKDQLPPGVFLVPGRRRTVGMNGGTGGGFRSGYIRNGKINQNDPEVEAGKSYRNLNRFDQLSATYFLIDAGGDSPANDFNGWEIDPAAIRRWPAHGGTTGKADGHITICFLDGHVESRLKGELPADHKDVFWQGDIR